MISRVLPLVLIFLAASYTSAEEIKFEAPKNLISSDIASSLLKESPTVAAANANLDVANQENGLLVRSPYEWTARATTQQRNVRSGERYTEWNVGVERPIRLLNKATFDKNLGQKIVSESLASYGEAMHEAALELAELWANWLTAENILALESQNLSSIEKNLAAVEMRTKAGDASNLELNLARAELAEQQRLTVEARTQATVSLTKLNNRFPTFMPTATDLPDPVPLYGNLEDWKERVITESDELKLAEIKVEKARIQADRLKADRIPDPTLGVFTASEVGGRERLVGVSVSMPIPTGLRNARGKKALAEVEVYKNEQSIVKRGLETKINSLWVNLQGLNNNFDLAQKNAQSMEKNAQLVQRAYTLGEADLQSLLLARRQAISANYTVLKTKSDSLKNYLELLVDAHLIWNLEHE